MKLEFLKKIFHTLNTAGIRYLVVGGIAVIAHGFSRMTMDLDLVISLDGENIKKALELLDRMGYQPKIPVKILEFAEREKREAWINKKNMVVFSVFNNDAFMPPIDIFADEPFDFEKEYGKAEAYEIDDEVWVPVVNLSTLISMKKLANRDKDRIDLSNLEYFQTSENNEKN